MWVAMVVPLMVPLPVGYGDSGSTVSVPYGVSIPVGISVPEGISNPVVVALIW